MNILHLDLETSGLDSGKHQILEIGAIYDPAPWSVGSNLEEDLDIVLGLKRFWSVVRHPMYHFEPYCLKLHTENGLLPLLWGVPPPKECSVSQNSTDFSTWMLQIAAKTQKFVLSGKNIGAFDLQFLKNWLPSEMIRMFFHYRLVDLGQMFVRFGKDSVTPDLAECLCRSGIGLDNELVGRKMSHLGTLHRALYDSVLCALAFRAHLRTTGYTPTQRS